MKINKEYLILSIISFILCVRFMIDKSDVVVRMVNLIINGLLILSIFQVVLYVFFKKQIKITSTIFTIILLLIVRIINLITPISPVLILIGIGLYQIFLGLVYLITAMLYINNKERGGMRYLFDAIVFLILGIPTVFMPLNSENQFIILSVYLLFLGLRYLREGLFYFHKPQNKRRKQVRLPVIFDALMPGFSLKKILHYEGEVDSITLKEHGVEIYIHATQGIQGATGHVDICVDNEVITYGCYDTPTTVFFGAISQGTLIKCNREEYLNFCKDTKDYVFGYSIKVNDDQIRVIKNNIEKLNNLLIEWKLDVEQHKKLNTQVYQLSQKTNAKLYKFKSSKFKTYFAATTNCCVLADFIVGDIGIDILNVRGFLTPGTYQSYLDNEMKKVNSFVLERNVY